MRLARLHSLRYVAIVACLVLSAAVVGPAAARPADTANVYVQPATDSGPLVPGHPTWPENPQVIPRPRATDDSSSSGFDWGAAGIGAGGTAVLVGMALAGIAVVGRRRRRPLRSQSVAP